MSPTEAIYWLIFLAGLAGALFNPVYGILLYVLVYHLYPESQWWGFRVEVWVPRTMFVIAAATAIGMVLNWHRMRRTESQFPMMFILMLLFLLYSFLASTTSSEPIGTTSSQMRLDKMVRISLFVFMMIRVVRTPKHFRWLLWSWMAGTIYIGYQAWSGIGITVSGRLSGGLGGPDFNQSSGLAAHLVPMIAIAGFLFYSSKSKQGKFFALLAAAFAVNTIILTRTRNAFPGILVLMIFGLLRLPRGVRLKCSLGIILGLFLSIRLTDEGWWERMGTLKNPEQDKSITRRYDYWKAAAKMAAEHPFGVGVGNFRRLVPEYVSDLEMGRSAHSTYFQCLAELGYPGLLLLLSIIMISLYQFEHARSTGKPWQNLVEAHPELGEDLRTLLLLATANEVAVAGFMVSAFFTSRLWVEGMWLLLAMSCCLYNISRTYRARLRKLANPVSAEPGGLAALNVGLVG